MFMEQLLLFPNKQMGIKIILEEITIILQC